MASHSPANPLVERYFAAAKEVGIPFNPDFNGAFQEGCGPLQATLANRARCSAADAYLHPARSRPNLTVLTHAYATKLLLSGARAVGVEYFRFGAVEQARAAREVIVSAGALRSPQLLMLSGIGPKAELERLGIEVRLDLPGVGRRSAGPPSYPGAVRDHATAHLCASSRGSEGGRAAEYEAIEAARSVRISSRREHSSKASQKRRIPGCSYSS